MRKDEKLLYEDQLTFEELPDEKKVEDQHLKAIDINTKYNYTNVIGKSKKQIGYACAVRLKGIKEFKEVVSNKYLADFIKKNNYLNAPIKLNNLPDRFIENYLNARTNAKDIIDDKNNMIEAILNVNKLIIHTGRF